MGSWMTVINKSFENAVTLSHNKLEQIYLLAAPQVKR
jgi:hypothetical protein